MIESRWQMDENNGVLRVISQPGVWSNGVPQVQTFQINSSNSITPLATMNLTPPRTHTEIARLVATEPSAEAPAPEPDDLTPAEEKIADAVESERGAV